MTVLKGVRRAARDGGNIVKSPGGQDPLAAAVKTYEAPSGTSIAVLDPSGTAKEPAKVSAPEADTLLATLDSLVKQHGISKILGVLGAIT